MGFLCSSISPAFYICFFQSAILTQHHRLSSNGKNRYNLKNKKLSAAIIISLLIFLAACSGGKKNSKLSLMGRFYHNTTARYNGYYYGKLKLNRVKESMTSSLQDDYTKLLPLFTDEAAGGASKSDLDSVIIKLTVVTQLHPRSKWVDDCYYFIGQSYFYKENFDDALSTFQYIVGAFKENGKKKKSSGGKKVKEGDVTIPWVKQGDGLGLSHKPVRNEALLWLLKSYISQKKYNEAQSIMKVLQSDNTFPYSLRDEFTLISAQLYIKQNRFAEAITPLKQAIVLAKKKKDKTRYTYILAQLYQQLNNSDKAIETFKKVIAMKPEYKMEFYANINIAKSFNGNGKTSATEVLAMLEKLARDDKFEEFRDQIYYTMAEVYLKQTNRPSAVKSLFKSIETSTTNTNQKALSYLKLAEMDFAEKKYLTAAGFYDSTAAFMSKAFEKYDETLLRKRILDELVFQTNIVTREDSLQKLANMPEKDLNKVLDAMIDAFEKKQKQDSAANSNMIVTDAKKTEENTDTKNGWYFYNVATKASGFNDFKKKWGNRKSEDNWRRSNKASSDDNGEAQNQNGNAQVSGGAKLTREDLKKDIPFGEDARKVSDTKIQNAMYAIGSIYKDDLRDYEMAIKTFEDLLKRYQQFPKEPAAFYSLYLLYTNTNVTMQIENYKQQLLKNYPNSDYAKLLQNPNFLNEKMKSENAIEDYYKAAFTLFEQKNYPAVIQKTSKADSLFKPNTLGAKFDLLESFAIAQLQPVDTFKTALKNIIKKYAVGEEVDKAKQLLGSMDKPKVDPKNSNKLPKDSLQVKENAIYQLHKTNPHYFVVVFNGDDPNIEAVKDSLSDFIAINYQISSLKVSSMMLDPKKEQQMILIKQMKNQDDAMDFYADASSQPFYDIIEDVDFYFFVIDDKNFATFFKNKNITDYMSFFDANYHP